MNARTIQQQLGQWPFFLAGVPVFFLLHLVNAYYPIFTARQLLFPIHLLYIGLPLLFLLLVWKRPAFLKYALPFLYIELLFFFFVPIHTWLNQYLPGVARYKYLVPFSVVTAILLFLFVRKRSGHSPRFFLYLNALLLVLVLWETVELTATSLTEGRSRFWFAKNPADSIQATPCDTCQQPDIYFIIFDGYSGEQALKEHWGYNNSQLGDFFREKGFFYAPQATSNYNSTPFSISTVLNMDFPEFRTNKTLNMEDFCKASLTVENNTVVNFLMKQQYTIINHSIFHLPHHQTTRDAGVINKKMVMWQQTLPGRFQLEAGWNFGVGPDLAFDSAQHREKLADRLVVYDSVLNTASRVYNKPVFVYGHFIIPHYPYYFDSTGHVTPMALWKDKSYAPAYLQQLKYATQLITRLTDHLLATATRPRIIIIQSDHGFTAYKGPHNPNSEFQILNAIYFPDKDYTGFQANQSAVNTFNVILNKYFHTHIPLKKDTMVTLK